MPISTAALGARMGSAPVRSIYRGASLIMPGVANLATNPGFEAASGTTVVRTNLATIPRATAYTAVASDVGFSSNRYTGDEAYSLLTGIVGGPNGITTAVRATWKTTATSGRGFHIASNNVDVATCTKNIPIAPGGQVTISAYFRTSNASAIMTLAYKFADATGTAISGGGAAAQTPLVQNAWTRVSQTTVVAPAGAAWVYFTAECAGAFTMAVGDTLDATGLLVEASPVLGAYLDGTLAATGDFTYAWAGIANASQSKMSGVGLSGLGTVGSSNAACIQSTDWAAGGAKSARVIPIAASNDSYVPVDPAVLTPYLGKTFTLVGTIRITAAQTGTLNANARMLAILGTGGAGPMLNAKSAAAPNVPGVYTLAVTAAIPSDITYLTFRGYNGASAGNGDVWWDDLMIVPGTYAGPYRDGSSPGWSWDAAANASASRGLS